MNELIYTHKKNGIEYRVYINTIVVRDWDRNSIFKFTVVDDLHYRKRKGIVVQEETMLLFRHISDFFNKHNIHLGYAYRADRKNETIEVQLNVEQINHFKSFKQLKRDKLIERILKY